MDWTGAVASIAALVIALGGVLVFALRNSANAQSILNKNYDAMSVRVNKLELDKEELVRTQAARDVIHAEERGGLNQRIIALEQQVSDERARSISASGENTTKIVQLQADLTLMQRDQATLQGKVDAITLERDTLSAQLLAVQRELERVHAREEQLQAEVIRLTTELAKRDVELISLHKQLDGDTSVQ